LKKRLELYDGTKTYMYPNGEIAEPERVYRDFPAAKIYPHMVETDEAGQVLFAIQNMAAMHAHYDLELPLEVFDLTDTMQELRRVEREAEDAKAALDAEQAILAAQQPVEIVMGGMDIARQVRSPEIEPALMAGVETATAVLTEARQKLRTAGDRCEKRREAIMPVIKAMEAVVNAPPAEDVPITAADRTASALELLCLLLMPDMEKGGSILTPELIELNYEQGLWGEQAVRLAAQKGNITAAEAKQIVDGAADEA